MPLDEFGVAPMPLSDVAIRAAKPGPKPIKLSDGQGLFLLVQPSGGKLWRLKYRVLCKEKKLSLGRYPDVPLRDARERCAEARRLIAAGVDPSEKKRQDKLDAVLRASNTFELVASEFIDKSEREGRAAVTVGKARWLLSLFDQALRARPVDEIDPKELLAALKGIEARGHLETARRMRSLAARVFNYAIATSRRSNANPATALRGALTAPMVKHHPALLTPPKVGALLRAIDSFDGQPMTQLALRLAPHVFLRPGELRQAEWTEIDLDGRVWVIAGSKMKMRLPHAVPLSKQSAEILTAAKALTGHHRYVFSSLYPGSRPMSENTINAALRRLGYSGEEMTGHGFRAMASTLLNESGLWSPDAVERALAHKDTNLVRASYHRGPHWEERVRMAQWWSDHLDGLRGTVEPADRE